MPSLLVIALVLSVNNFGIALAMGGLGLQKKRIRIGLVFGVFEFLMPLAGLFAGRALADQLLSVAQWSAPGLIAALGVWTRSGGDRKSKRRFGRLR